MELFLLIATYPPENQPVLDNKDAVVDSRPSFRVREPSDGVETQFPITVLGI